MNGFEILKQAERVYADTCRANLSKFFKASWRVLEPQTELKWNWHHDLICEYLQAVRSGQIRRLIINIAPRTTKSLMATVCFPAWVWASNPHERFLFGSYADSLATKHSTLRRNLIASDWYQASYPEVILSSDENMKTEFSNTATGVMKATGIKGSITGLGGNYIVIDDAHNPKGAESEAERESICQNFDLAWSTRLNDKATGRIVIIMQRLHQNDLTGHLLSKDLGYEHLKIPTVSEKQTVVQFPISHKQVIRNEGDLLHPDRDGMAEIEQAKKAMGSYGFAGQHQQNPVPREGAIIKHEWIAHRFYKELPARHDATLQSWDCAFKGTESSDPVCGLVWSRVGGEYYLWPKRFYGRVDLPGTIAAVKALVAAYPEVKKRVVEDKANGPAVIDSLKREVSGLVEFNPNRYGDKEQRLTAVSPLFEAGNVWLPDPSIAPWVHDYIEELTTFPRSAHKDQVDATSQALLVLSERKTVSFAPVSITAPSKWHGAMS